MTIPSAPDTTALRQGLTQVGRITKIYRFKFTSNWNIPNLNKTLTQFSSKDFRNLSNLTKAMNEQKGMLDELKKIKQTATKVEETKKAATVLKKVQDALLKNVPGTGDAVGKASKAGNYLKLIPSILSIFAVILGLSTMRVVSEINETNLNTLQVLAGEFNVQLRLIKKAFSNTKKLEARTLKVEKDIAANNASISRTNKDFYSINVNSQNAKKNANDALYEVRAGRKILEGKVDAAKKQANDALYETRKGRDILQGQIDKLSKDVSKYLLGVKDNFQERIDTTIKGIVKSLDANTDKIVEHNKAIISLQDGLKLVQASVKDIPKSIDSKIADLKDFTVKLINGKIQPIEIDIKKTNSDLATVQTTGVTRKEYEGTTASLLETYNKSYEAQSAKWNDELRAVQGKVGEITKVVTGSDFTSANAQTTKDIAGLKADLTTTKKGLEQQKLDLEKQKNDLGKIDNRIKEQEKVNQSAIPKLDDILKALPLIPGRAADAIKPSIPTKDDIKQATGQAICSSLNGGCSGKANADLANNINNNTNNRAGDILGAVNAGENTAQIAMLTDIQNRIGAQVPGGVTGFLGRFAEGFEKFAEWSKATQVYSLVTLFVTIHNGLMLSNNLGQTLFSLIGNGLQIVGLKDKEGNPYDVGSIITHGIEGMIQGVVGAENYAALNTAFKKANRIYQASANLLNAVQSIGQSTLNALQVIGGQTGKIGNALRAWGVVGETAYNWFNPQPNFQNKFFTGLETAQNVVSQIDSIASEVLSVEQTVQSLGGLKEEVDKSMKDEDPSKRPADTPESASEKEKADTAKIASAAKDIDKQDTKSAGDD